ncbi:MAG: hypothetical protein GX027_03365 [Clostridiaceae bacterium]|nr:hypothetical protein [Clostridiaceae bacterium]
MIENVSGELRKYLEGKPFISALLGFGMIILYVSLGIMLFHSFVFLGGFIGGLIEYIFIFAVVLCLANADFQTLMIGLGARAVIALIHLFQGIFGEYFQYFSWSAFFALLIYGFFAFMAFKKTDKKA